MVAAPKTEKLVMSIPRESPNEMLSLYLRAALSLLRLSELGEFDQHELVEISSLVGALQNEWTRMMREDPPEPGLRRINEKRGR
jgi:hypothetical protein